MTSVDDRGLARGTNLVDAFVAVIILVMIPVAYGAYLLFRTPPAKLLSIAPANAIQSRNLQIELTGENLRPFMRVSFNTIQARNFLLGSTKTAVVGVPDLGPGVYDVVLYDYMQEVSRLPKALTIMSMPTDVEVEAAGSFKSVSREFATSLKSGDQFPPAGHWVAKVVAVGNAVPSTLNLRAGQESLSVPFVGQNDLPATVRVRCQTSGNPDGSVRCLVPGPDDPAVMAANSLLKLPTTPGWVLFQIAEVHATTSPSMATARVRFVGSPELLAKLRAGDRDATIRAFGQDDSAILDQIGSSRPLAPLEAGRLALVGGAIGGPLNAVDATVRVPVRPGPAGLTYRNESFKAGAPFSFETPQYVVRGEVISVTPATPSSLTIR